MTKENRRSSRAQALTILALLTLAPLSGCGSDEPPGRPKPTPPAPVENKAQGPAARGADAPDRPALAVSPTEWPGVEGRLSTLQRNGNLLLVEVRLVNTGTAPVTIERYSATDATMTDDVSKKAYHVFQIPGGQPAATTDLTQTLQPGESTAVNASFPVPVTAQLVTVTFPRIGLFEAVKPYAGNSQPQPRDKADKGEPGKKAEKNAKK
jgi:hypothetical protein